VNDRDDALARVIAIDGPAGSGKSTVARGVADELGLEVLDTGAMYRAVTFAVLEDGIDPGDRDRVAAMARAIDLVVGPPTVVNGVDATEAIRGPEVTAHVSAVAANPDVRAALVKRQQAWILEHGGGVVEGRDIGTVVAPNARVKVFLTASDRERARRRQRDEEASARDVDVDSVQAAMARRDTFDSNRAVSPLQAADDALVIDTTGRSASEVVALVTDRVRLAVKEAP
jgi:cytidylate kinase